MTEYGKIPLCAVSSINDPKKDFFVNFDFVGGQDQ